MKRRQFIGYTGMAAATILAGEFLIPSKAWSGISDEPEYSSTGMGWLPRTTGGRCHDHRFIMNGPGQYFERDIIEN